MSDFNAEKETPPDYLNICLSYPFVQDNNIDDGGQGENRRYLLFYRWVPWCLLVLAFVYYIPRKLSKNFDNAKCKKLIEDLATKAHQYDHTENELVERVARYLIFNLNTHNGLYWKYLSVNILALFIDLFAMKYLDFIL